MEIILSAGFEKLIKDREGEIKLTFTIPLSDQEKALQIPHQELLTLKVSYGDREKEKNTELEDI